MSLQHFPLRCRCHASNWEFHTTKVVCLTCQFTEHFEVHETIADLITRMKGLGCYFLDKDKDLLKNGPVVQLTGHNYR